MNKSSAQFENSVCQQAEREGLLKITDLQKDFFDLHLCFSSGMSKTIQSANMAIEELKEEYPDRKILCLDTLCAAVGEGLFVPRS